ncbi:extracellular solute-binding protein [Rhodobacterales bacterium HKCCE2091]|nr:extracellular solute-binding protein [Rhodobacterales bacterium HKCCE2091]
MIRAALLAIAAAVHAAPTVAQEAVATFGPGDAGTSLVLRTTTDIDVFGPTVAAFLATRPDLSVRFEQWGSNDLHALTAADCAAGQRGADIVISSGVHQMVDLVNERCAADWRSAATAALPPDLRWRDEIWGISREPAVIVYNRRLVPADEVPRTRFDILDLLRPATSVYAGRVATYDIEASGLGFLFAYADSQEASTFGALMEAFARSGAVATCCSAEIIRGVAEGDYLIAYNVLGSYAALEAAENPDLGIVLPGDYTLVLSRAAILPGPEPARDAAGAFLDFLLSPEGQREMALMQLRMDEEEEDGTVPFRSIPLSPVLLVAMDRAHESRFIARWRAAFGAPEP